MKLNEIINATHFSADLDDAQIRAYQKRFAGGELVDRITSSLQLRFIESENTYTLVKDDVVIGWLQLDNSVTLFKTVYDVIGFIFIVPEIRKTRAAGAFLVALKRHLRNPLILGSDKYGGVLFKGGFDLVKALNSASRSDVSVLNLKTGEKMPLGDSIPESPAHLTLVFENNSFPVHHLDFDIFEGAENRLFEDGKI